MIEDPEERAWTAAQLYVCAAIGGIGGLITELGLSVDQAKEMFMKMADESWDGFFTEVAPKI